LLADFACWFAWSLAGLLVRWFAWSLAGLLGRLLVCYWFACGCPCLIGISRPNQFFWTFDMDWNKCFKHSYFYDNII
jgi:hypothetical protein